MGNLFEVDDGKRSEKNPSLWDMDFLTEVKNELKRNFSREKLDYYEKVVKYVLKDRAKQLGEDEAKQVETKEENPLKPNKDWISDNKKLVLVGLVVIGIALSVIGLCFSKEDFPNLSKATFITLKAAITTLGIAGVFTGGILLNKEIRNK